MIYEKETWWGVQEKSGDSPKYLYKDIESARNQADRNGYWIINPFYVQEQTPSTQENIYKYGLYELIKNGICWFILGILITIIIIN